MPNYIRHYGTGCLQCMLFLDSVPYTVGVGYMVDMMLSQSIALTYTSKSNKHLLLTNLVFQQESVVYGWEFSVESAGTFEFAVRTLSH